ncbi:MAG: ectonucleotide pyrophosphatase/phosphodiesterase [Oceanicaulis sp.]
MTAIRTFAGLCAGLFLASCATPATDPAPALPAAEQPERVLLIGLDGLRPDMVERYGATHLQALAARGTTAEAMIPVMPSVTFVNFYSIATGLYPQTHGMVTNAPYDSETGETFVNGISTSDPKWWGGEPIWITAERQGLATGVMFWLGSETAIDGVRPTDWSPYEHEKPYQERVDTVLSWFDRLEEERPRFAAVYFDRVDTAGHAFGPEDPRTAEAVAEVDDYVGQLVEGLRARGLLETTNIMVVSDHGMARLDFNQTINLDPLIDFDSVHAPEMEGRHGAGLRPFVTIFGEPGAIDAAHDALNGAHPHLQVWRRGETPERFRFDHPTRGPDLFVLADVGWSLTAPSLVTSPRAAYPGVHGYDNAAPEMAATFIGAGPRFDEGASAAPFENVNLYAVMACALGLEPAQTDADPAVVARLTGGRCSPD